MGRGARRRKQLLNDLKCTGEYCKLKHIALGGELLLGVAPLKGTIHILSFLQSSGCSQIIRINDSS